jgi:L-amino acid N-acyltransferase YncA
MENANSSSVTIRPMTSKDYEQFVALHNLVYPTRTRTVEEVTKADQTRSSKIAAGRKAASYKIGW